MVTHDLCHWKGLCSTGFKWWNLGAQSLLLLTGQIVTYRCEQVSPVPEPPGPRAKGMVHSRWDVLHTVQICLYARTWCLLHSVVCRVLCCVIISSQYKYNFLYLFVVVLNFFLVFHHLFIVPGVSSLCKYAYRLNDCFIRSSLSFSNSN